MTKRLGTADDVAIEIGLASASAARSWIRRHKPKVHGRTGPRDAKLYDLDECAAIRRDQPGQGARTDLTAHRNGDQLVARAETRD